MATDRDIALLIQGSLGYRTTVGLIDRQKVQKALDGKPSVKPHAALAEAAWWLARDRMGVSYLVVLALVRDSIGYRKTVGDLDKSKVQRALMGIPSVRPHSALGEAAWELARRCAPPSPKPEIGVFSKPGAMWVQSDSEDVATAHACGLEWALLQLGGDDWSVLANRCNVLGIPWGYWFHCRTYLQLTELLRQSVGRALVGINIEQELNTTLTPRVVRAAIDASYYHGEVAIVAMGWVQNDVRVTRQDLGDYAWLLEIFPQDAPALMPPADKWPQCREHALSLGVEHPYQLMGVYGDAVPSWYPPDLSSSIYAANNIEQREGWQRWLQR